MRHREDPVEKRFSLYKAHLHSPPKRFVDDDGDGNDANNNNNTNNNNNNKNNNNNNNNKFVTCWTAYMRKRSKMEMELNHKSELLFLTVNLMSANLKFQALS